MTAVRFVFGRNLYYINSSLALKIIIITILSLHCI